MERLGLESVGDLTAVFGHAKVEPSPSGQRASLPAPPGLEVMPGGEGEALVLSFPLGDLAPPSGLTQTELQVVHAAVRGLTNSDIARSRGVSPRTVANQLAHVFAKLRVGSRLELALRWHQEAPAIRSSAGAAA
jgi:DNA-binding CsgD family transcriptional regulator